jgi:uncharacterized protein YecE (DUF72 family)
VYTGFFLLGTSGWSYAEWVGVFYPNSSESKLGFYSKIFPTAEIDSTFYAFPKEGMVTGWDRYSPRNFVFNAKLPQTITHERLEGLGRPIEEELDKFANLMLPLNNSGKLGCLLIQLPPKYKYDPSHLEEFLSLLPHGFKYAIEFRHKSWMRDATWKTLSKYNVAYTIVDEPLLPPEVHVTADFAYMRWHGRGQRPWYDYHYTERELADWVPKVKEVEGSVKTTYGYFNNHFHGYAVENGLSILKMLGKLTPTQEDALKHARSHLKQSEEKPVGLREFTRGGEDRATLVEMLGNVMGETRLARSFTIPDDDVKVKEANQKAINANVRDYTIKMDMSSRTIIHDCGDWERAIETRQLCKHIGKVFLTISEKMALQWVSAIQEDIDGWKFQQPEK